MLNQLRRLDVWGDQGATLWNALGLLLILASALNFAADLGRRELDSLWYALADNLFVACAALGLALTALAPSVRLAGAGEAWARRDRLIAGAVLGAGTLLAVLGGIRAIWGGVGRHDLAVSALLGTGVALLATTLARPDGAERAAPVPAERGWAYGMLAVVLIAGVVLRQAAPGSTVQTWIVAPLQVLVAPGIGLGLALLPFQFSQPPVEINAWRPVAAFAGLVLITTIAGYGAYAWALRHLQASVASILALTEVPFASLFAFLLLGERMSWLQVLGALAILGGVVLLATARAPAEVQDDKI